jgi:HEAT repeat protein
MPALKRMFYSFTPLFMKKLLSFLYLFLVTGFLMAQANRTLTTRVADVLAQFPANDAAQLNNNMAEMAALGEAGILEMTRMLGPAGQGDNSRLQYALGGFSYYVASGNKEDLRAQAAQAYIKALSQVQDPENKAFLFTQLQMVGKDEAVAALAPYLAQDRFCDPAARALIKISSPAAQQALLAALSNGQGRCQLSLVEALGDARYAAAAAALTPLATSGDPQVKKLALLALANIGQPASEAVLAAEAEKAGYTYDKADATAAYLLWAERMLAAGNTPAVETMAQALLNKATQDHQVHTRVAALTLLVRIKKEASLPLLLAAAKDKNRQYRVAALKLATPLTGADHTPQWLAVLSKAEPAVKADVITLLGNRADAAALPALLKETKSKHSAVKLAAITAAGKVGQEAALPQLLKVMKKGKAKEIAAAKMAVLTMKGANVVPQVAQALPKMRPPARAALLEVLGTRQATAYFPVVQAQTSAKDTTVRLAAFQALRDMSDQEHLPVLYPLLLGADTPKEVTALQGAVFKAVNDVKDKTQQTDIILQQMSQAPAGKKHLYYAVLAHIGSAKALQAVVAEFNTGDEATKQAALAALSRWSDFAAAGELYKIAQAGTSGAFFQPALTAYIRQISGAALPAEQKLILLRKAMEVAQTPEQKNAILREIGKGSTYLGLIYAGKYLSDPSLQQSAANAVASIALANKSLMGADVKTLLNQAMGIMKGSEVEYTKANIRKYLDEMPAGEGFVSLFNGQDLTGWKGLVADPIKRAKMDAKTLAAEQAKADEVMRQGWKVENGALVFTGKGDNIASVKKYGDIEMLVDWKIYDDGHKDGDAGIYLRGTPQVQMWDTSRVDVGAQVGSGGLYNNKVNPSKPGKVADNPLGEWNNFRILMVGDRVTVYLNGELVTDNVILENYWDRGLPIFAEEQVELQAHGSRVAYRDVYIREIPRPEPFTLSAAEKKAGFKVLFDGTNMHNWQGNITDYNIENGEMVVRKPKFGSGGNLFTREEYGDFTFRFEFKLTPGANNGLGIRAPLTGDAAYEGMEIQILDNDADIYKNLHEYQFHGSVYGIMPAKRGFLKPVGEWNYEEVTVKGSKIKVVLNGTTILDGDLAEATKNGTLDKKDHPGLKRRKGYIGFLGHGSTVWFRNIRIKDLGPKDKTLSAKN